MLVAHGRYSSTFLVSAKGVAVYRIDTERGAVYQVVTSNDLNPGMYLTTDKDDAMDRFRDRKDR